MSVSDRVETLTEKYKLCHIYRFAPAEAVRWKGSLEKIKCRQRHTLLKKLKIEMQSCVRTVQRHERKGLRGSVITFKSTQQKQRKRLFLELFFKKWHAISVKIRTCKHTSMVGNNMSG